MMASLKGFFAVLGHTDLAIPTHEMMLLLVVMTFCMLLRAVRLGLILAFVFVYRWGWLFFQETFGENQVVFFRCYIAFGVVVVALTTIRMLKSE